MKGECHATNNSFCMTTPLNTTAPLAIDHAEFTTFFFIHITVNKEVPGYSDSLAFSTKAMIPSCHLKNFSLLP